MRTSVAIGLAGMVVAASTMLSIGSADASANAVIIKPIDVVTSSASAVSTARVRPSVSKTGQVKIVTKRITVRLAGKKIVTKAKSVRLRAGTYRITTIVTYKTYTKSHGKKKYSRIHTKSRTRTAFVHRACATDAEFASVVTRDQSFVPAGPATPPGDTLAVVRSKLHTVGAPASPFPAEGYILAFLKCDGGPTLYVGIDATGHAYNKLDSSMEDPS